MPDPPDSTEAAAEALRRLPARAPFISTGRTGADPLVGWPYFKIISPTEPPPADSLAIGDAQHGGPRITVLPSADEGRLVEAVREAVGRLVDAGPDPPTG